MPIAMEAPATIRAPRAVMWTREDCRKFEADGVLPARWELVQGEIISKMGTNVPHSMFAHVVSTWLNTVFGRACVLPTCSIDVAPEDNPTSAPEADIVVVNRPASEFHQQPTPGDIVLLVEVSDTTLAFDLGSKAQLYARAGIQEYWVVDINSKKIDQHREPSPEGYRSLRTVTGASVLSPLAKPEATLTAEELFG